MVSFGRIITLILLVQLSVSLFLPTSAAAEMSKARTNVLLNICESAIKNGDRGTIVTIGRQLDGQALPKDERLIQRADACINAYFEKSKMNVVTKPDEIILEIQAHRSKLDKLCDALLELVPKIAIKNNSCRRIIFD